MATMKLNYTRRISHVVDFGTVDAPIIQHNEFIVKPIEKLEGMFGIYKINKKYKFPFYIGDLSHVLNWLDN